MQARKEGEEQCIQLKQNNGNKRREKERGRRWKEQAKRLGETTEMLRGEDVDRERKRG